MLLASIGVDGRRLWMSNGSAWGRRVRGGFQLWAFSRGMIGGMIGGYDKMTMCNYAYGATPGNLDDVQTPNHMEKGV